jgi:isocitrate/isopropylmalate dehydrogenase
MTEKSPRHEQVARHRAIVAGAADTRQLEHEEAERVRSHAIKQANKRFAAKVAAAREENVPWSDLAAAAGVSRQVLDQLIRDAE